MVIPSDMAETASDRAKSPADKESTGQDASVNEKINRFSNTASGNTSVDVGLSSGGNSAANILLFQHPAGWCSLHDSHVDAQWVVSGYGLRGVGYFVNRAMTGTRDACGYLLGFT